MWAIHKDECTVCKKEAGIDFIYAAYMVLEKVNDKDYIFKKLIN